jgi:hypothetical protein
MPTGRPKGFPKIGSLRNAGVGSTRAELGWCDGYDLRRRISTPPAPKSEIIKRRSAKFPSIEE